MEITIISYILKLNVLECLNDRKLRRETSGLCPPKAEATGSNLVGCAKSLSWIELKKSTGRIGIGAVNFSGIWENEGFV